MVASVNVEVIRVRKAGSFVTSLVTSDFFQERLCAKELISLVREN
jgi:hypothetical protein